MATKSNVPTKAKQPGRSFNELIGDASNVRDASTRMVLLDQNRTMPIVETPKTVRRPRTGEEILEFVRSSDGSKSAKLCNHTMSAVYNSYCLLKPEFHGLRTFISREQDQQEPKLEPEDLEKFLKGTMLGRSADQRNYKNWLRRLREDRAARDGRDRGWSAARLALDFICEKTGLRSSAVKTYIARAGKVSGLEGKK